MVRTKDRERVMLVDVSKVANSAQALKTLEQFVSTMVVPGQDSILELNCGNLLLTPKVFSKIRNLIHQHEAQLETVYALLPQTQQAALDCGLFVREKPSQDAIYSVTTMLKTRAQEASSHMQVGQAATGTHGKSAPANGATLPFGDTMSLDLDALDEEFSTPIKDIAGITPEPVASEPEAPAADDFQPDALEQDRPTLYLQGTLRSGQTIRYDGNLVIVGDVHGGSEVAATGDVMIWGELRGIAHAGARGDRYAEVRALKIEAIQLRIADVIARRPDRIYNHKPDEDRGVPSPEVARITEGEIKIFNDVIGR